VLPGRKLGPRGTDGGWFDGEALTVAMGQQRGTWRQRRARWQCGQELTSGKGVDVVELRSRAVLLDVVAR
jgi:hypothetical protein